MTDTRAYSNVCYDEIQEDSEVNQWLVYTVTSQHLPSQYRSLKLYPVAIDDVEPEPEYDVTKPRFSSRCVYLILASVFVLSLTVAATICFLEIRKVTKDEKIHHITGTANTVNISTYRASSHRSADVLISLLDNDQRTPCLSTCRPYSKPKFRSRCVAGYCVCGGEGYQPSTCLPIVHDCVIQRSQIDGRARAKALLEAASVPVYTCTTRATSSSTHVVSVYGNHFAEQTAVSVSGALGVSVTLVLASHYPIHWKLKYNDVDLQRIVVISDLDPTLSTVENTSAKNSNFMPPEVTYNKMAVGYGDDRHNSNTTDMLRSLTGRLGPISSFSGAAFADYFSLKI